jgi:hypothetical protein
MCFLFVLGATVSTRHYNDHLFYFSPSHLQICCTAAEGNRIMEVELNKFVWPLSTVGSSVIVVRCWILLFCLVVCRWRSISSRS